MKQNYNDTGSGTVTAREGARGRAVKPEMDMEEMLRKAETTGTPGEGHKALEHFTGAWKAEVKCWMDPGGTPNVSQATAKVNWVMNGRFLEEDFRGEMMGKPFRGRTVMGYDNIKQTFKSVWISDMQTSMFVTEGKGENGNKVLTLRGSASCGARGRTDTPMRVVLRVLGPDKHVFEMFDESRGENGKTMEITYTRQ